MENTQIFTQSMGLLEFVDPKYKYSSWSYDDHFLTHTQVSTLSLFSRLRYTELGLGLYSLLIFHCYWLIMYDRFNLGWVLYLRVFVVRFQCKCMKTFWFFVLKYRWWCAYCVFRVFDMVSELHSSNLKLSDDWRCFDVDSWKVSSYLLLFLCFPVDLHSICLDRKNYVGNILIPSIWVKI